MQDANVRRRIINCSWLNIIVKIISVESVIEKYYYRILFETNICLLDAIMFRFKAVFLDWLSMQILLEWQILPECIDISALLIIRLHWNFQYDVITRYKPLCACCLSRGYILALKLRDIVCMFCSLQIFTDTANSKVLWF